MAEAVGRLLIVGFEGTDFAEVERLVTEVRPSGLVFFKRNYPPDDGPERLREFIERAQALAESVLGRRLFMAIDHEGGRVQRLPAPYTILPSAAEAVYGRGMSPADVEALAFQAGRELAGTGFNFNFAPVLDVAPPGSVFMSDRSFGGEPLKVAGFGRACLMAYRRAGLLGAGKHFPGLGAAELDPHHELPTINSDRRRLFEVDLAPFRELIAEGGLAAVMTTHALYPALDAERAATFSEAVVGLLKGGMGFDGAVLTDDLEMGAVAKNYPLGEAAVSAVRAGHDLCLVCRRADYIDECRRALASAVAGGLITEARLTDARRRIDRLLSVLAAAWPAEARRRAWFEEMIANN
ncbi:beta-N-acetylhexosaminidase [Deltaproteobacteria bacterium OttesenSCG-928-M10]|nr:beta-N-acetylhexosaminidase [Deltaproteobacteria bacterium OttesenSCG-928-M10]